MREADAWLPDLVPPAGGLARLRNSIEARRTRRGAWPSVAAAACVAMGLVVCLLLLPGLLHRHEARDELVRAVHQVVRPPRPVGLRMIEGTALALESGQAGVHLYLVQPVRKPAAIPRP